MTFRRIAWLIGALTLLPAAAAAQTPSQKLSALSLDELMKLEVTTVTKLPQARLQAPASVYVLTQDDIRRSGATTLAELLRLVPGVHVAEIDGNKWGIGIRGFTDRLARAMLVLIDGRAVYSPLFAGTYWEVQDLPLDDIERIEVVRGPGGALWGANAVTGIVNVIRKRASATQGTAVHVRTGTEDPFALSIRYGGSKGAGFQYRASGKLSMRSAQQNPLGLEYDDSRLAHAGVRADWDTKHGAFTLQGDLYRVVIGNRDTVSSYSPPSAENIVTEDPMSGGNVLFRWSAESAHPRAPRLQVYYDRTNHDELQFNERQSMLDIDYQQGGGLGRHELLWGAGYRVVDSRTQTGGLLRLMPANRTDSLATAFLQDDVTLVPGRLELIGGIKAEHNVFSGLEWQPSGRLIWTLSPAHALSFSAIRAVRTPSRVERDFESGNFLSAAGPTFIRLLPNGDFDSEELIAYEASLVSMVTPRVMTTLALFHNQHDNVLSTELGATFTETDANGTRTVIPVFFANGLQGYSDGGEVTVDARPTAWWRVTANYSALSFHLNRRPGSTDLTQEGRAERGSPRHQLQLTTSLNLSRRLVVDWFLRYVSALPAVGVPAYSTSNVRVEWTFNSHLSVFVAGRNLHHATHAEFSDGANGTFGIQRAALIGLRWNR